MKRKYLFKVKTHWIIIITVLFLLNTICQNAYAYALNTDASGAVIITKQPL